MGGQLERLAGGERVRDRDRIRDDALLAPAPAQLDAALLRRLPGVRGVAPAAAQVALAEADEERRLADVRPLALHRGEDFDQVRRLRQAYASKSERPIAISAITSSRRSGRDGSSRTRMRAT